MSNVDIIVVVLYLSFFQNLSNMKQILKCQSKAGARRVFICLNSEKYFNR